MMWAAFPLERVPQDLWQTPPTERQANWRKNEVAKFRAVATPKERFWTNKLQTMWPKGWNSQYPGKPVTKGATYAMRRNRMHEPARDLEMALDMIQRWETDPRTARDWLRCSSREDLADILQGLEKGLAPSDRTQTTAAIASEAREVLRTRKLQKKPRDFVRFFYGNRIAGDMDLPNIFREPDVYRLHPEPEVAAAIMVVHRFAPQISAELFNYKDWAMKPGPLPPGDPTTCRAQVGHKPSRRWRRWMDT